jgi:hypothetical protein
VALCVGDFGEQPPFSSDAPVMVQRAKPTDACSTLVHPAPLRGAILLAERGGCTFVDKARVAAGAGAAGLIVINNGSNCLIMGGSGSGSAGTSESVSSLRGLFIASATNETGAELGQWVGREVTYVGIRAHVLDPAAVFLLVLALVVLTVAALWSGKSFEDHLKREQHCRRGSEEDSQHALGVENGGACLCKIFVPGMLCLDLKSCQHPLHLHLLQRPPHNVTDLLSFCSS